SRDWSSDVCSSDLRRSTGLLFDDHNLVNRRSVHIYNFKFKRLPEEFFTWPWNTTQFNHDQTANCIDFVVAYTIFHTKSGKEICQRILAVNQPGFFIALHQDKLLIVKLRYITDQGFQDITDGNDTLCRAVFINNQGVVNAGGFELFKRLV